MFTEHDAPILLVFGQSNAHGHSLAMAPKDRISHPLAHVLGLRQADNQNYQLEKPVWSGYTSDGTNLGEIQDHTYCMPNYFSLYWEEECRKGPAAWPALRIIRISVGAEGVTQKFMWHPDYPLIQVPGPLGTVRLALYSLACQVLRCVTEDLKQQGKIPKILALHWLGGEEDTCIPPEELQELEPLYHRIMDGFFEAAGGSFPIRFYEICSRKRVLAMGEYEESLHIINNTFHRLAVHYPSSAVISAADSPDWDETDPLCGIFQPDGGHYTARTQEWFARKAFSELCSSI